jgi:hypothetical protein
MLSEIQYVWRRGLDLFCLSTVIMIDAIMFEKVFSQKPCSHATWLSGALINDKGHRVC